MSLSEKYRLLEDIDLSFLNAIERGMRENKWVPEKKVPSLVGYSAEESDYRLDLLNEHELIERKTQQYTGYQLTFEGYDLLVLDALVKSGDVTELGGIVNSGKESVIYKCKRGDEKLVLKLHREGYTDFREVDRVRDYTSDKHHVSWFYTARQAAERENNRLETLYPDVSVPEPINQNRHGILLELVEGCELRRVTVDSPRVVFDAVVRSMRKVYNRGVVHGDMSEYNVMVSESDIYLIDWPQSGETGHPHAVELLERDVDNLVSFFERKYVDLDLPSREEVLSEITGKK